MFAVLMLSIIVCPGQPAPPYARYIHGSKRGSDVHFLSCLRFDRFRSFFLFFGFRRVTRRVENDHRSMVLLVSVVHRAARRVACRVENERRGHGVSGFRRASS